MAKKKTEEIEEREVTIVDIRDVPAIDPERVGKTDVLVTWQIDPARTYRVRIPKEEFDEERLKAEIRKELKAKLPWIGKRIVV